MLIAAKQFADFICRMGSPGDYEIIPVAPQQKIKGNHYFYWQIF